MLSTDPALGTMIPKGSLVMMQIHDHLGHTLDEMCLVGLPLVYPMP
jgi:hypothetical protein